MKRNRAQAKQQGQWWLVLAFLLVGRQALAGGFEHSDNGTKAVGRGGAFAVRADDLTAMIHNPAGLAKLHGTHLLLNDNVSWLNLTFRRSPTPFWDPECNIPGWSQCQQPMADPNDPSGLRWVHFDPVRNNAGAFPLGATLAVASDFGLEDWTFALGLFGPSALGQARYPQNGPQRFMLVEMNLVLLYPTASVAWKYKDIFGVGVSMHAVTMPSSKFAMMIDGYQDRTLYPAASSWEVLADMELSDPFRFTMTVGVWYRPFRFLEFAVASQVIPVNIHARGKVKVSPQSAQKPGCTPGPGVDCEQSIIYGQQFEMSNDGASLSFALPAKLRGGVRYVHWRGDRPLFDLEMNVNYENWSAMDRYRLRFADDARITVRFQNGDEQVAKLSKIDLIKNWNDTVSVRLGGDFNAVRDTLWLRLGGYFETATVPQAYSNLDFPAFQRWGLGGGFTVVPYRGIEISGAYQHIFQQTRNLAEDESKVFQQRPAAYCDTSTQYSRGPNGDPKCDIRSYYDGMPGAPVGGGLYQSSYDVLSFGLNINWNTLIYGRETPAAQLDRDGVSAWAP